MSQLETPLKHLTTAAILATYRVTLLVHHLLFLSDQVSTFTLGACDGNPCMNGGQCVDMGTESNPKQFTCACAEGYTGLTCQKRIDPCADEPCQNGGICEPRGEHYHCSCTERFRGKLCEQYIRQRNPCLGDPCGAHGYCEVVNYDFVCDCSPGYHGSRCEYSENPPSARESESLVVAADSKEDSEKALVIGEVILALFILVVVILLLLGLHYLRVANKRSKHKSAQEVKAANGRETEPTPGWFEASNDLCYNFWCYCCKLVNKHENDKKIIIDCNDPMAKECFDRCMKEKCGGGTGDSALPAALKAFESALDGQPKAIGSGALGPAGVPPSRSASKSAGASGVGGPTGGGGGPGSGGSKPPSRTASRKNSLTGFGDQGPFDDENDAAGNATANQNAMEEESECWECLPYMDRSHNRAVNPAVAAARNRAAIPRYSVARHYPIMPARNSGGHSRYNPGVKMVEDRRPASGDGGRRTARGVLPGFQPCSEYLLADPVGDVDGEGVSARGPSKKMRVLRRAPPRGRSRGAIVDIVDCENDEDEDGEDDDGEFEDDDDGAMVGPQGNILPMAFRSGAVEMGRGAGHVDPMFFDEVRCSNQSNSFGTYAYDGPYSDTGDNRHGRPNGRQRYFQRRGANSVYRNNHAADSESDDDGGDSEGDGVDDNDDVDNHDDFEEDDDDDDDADDADDDDGDDSPFFPPRQARRPPPRRRARRLQGRRDHRPPEDDGYSSTGRMSESDAGGRSRDPLSMEAATRQAQRNFYEGQSRPSSHPPAPHPENPSRTQSRVSRQELADYAAVKKGQQGRPNILLSPHSAAPGTPPVVYSNCPSPAQQQQRFESLKSSSRYPMAPAETHRATPAFYHQSQLQHQHQQDRLAPSAAFQGHKANPYYQNQPSLDAIDAALRECTSAGSSAELRRPRHSQQGWDRSLRAAAPGAVPPYTQAALTQEKHIPPTRRQKVKGILKKTSAYGGSNSTRGSGWGAGGGYGRSSNIPAYGYTPRRPSGYPPPYAPPPYQQYVA